MKISRRLTLAGSVLLAAVSGFFVVSSFSSPPETTTVLRAKSNIPVGVHLSSENLEPVQLPIDIAKPYVRDLEPGLFASVSVLRGEILAKSSVTNVSNSNRVRITITPQQLPVGELIPAEELELWAVASSQTGTMAGASQQVALLSPDAVLLEKSSGSGGFGLSTNTIDVLVKRVDLPLVLEALASPNTQIVLVRRASA